MPNMWKKKMVEQGNNHLDGPIHSTAKCFETRIENLEKSIPLSVPSRNRKKNKGRSKKRKSFTFDNSEDNNLIEGHKGEISARFMACVDILQMST